MSRYNGAPTKKSDIFLGRQFSEKRRMSDLTRIQLAKKINVVESQITKYETGAFISLPRIELLANALGEPVIKKVIRKISFVRKTEKEKKVNLDDELIELYSQIFEDDYS